MSETYRMTWEMVNTTALYKYMDADPMYYKGCTQTVPNSEVPDEDWYKVGPKEIEGGLENDQFKQLTQWASENREFIRNVVLERLVTQPSWEVVVRS